MAEGQSNQPTQAEAEAIAKATDLQLGSGEQNDPGTLLGNNSFKNHRHTGLDSPRISYNDLLDLPVDEADVIELEAGEAITAGEVVGITMSYVDLPCSQSSYVYQAIAFQNTNFGTSTILQTGQDGSGFVWIPLVQFDMTTCPSPEYIIKAEMRLTVVGNLSVANQSLDVFTVSWDQSTVTFNTLPASVGLTTLYPDQTSAIVGSTDTETTWDITRLTMGWKTGDLDNYGVRPSGGGGSANWHSDNSATASKKPFLRVYSTQESDGLAYKADISEYATCRCVLGVAQNSVSAGGTVRIKTTGQRQTSSGLNPGSPLFLSTTPGALTDSANNSTRTIRFGRAVTGTEYLIQTEQQDILINKFYTSWNIGGTATRVYAPADAKYALLYLSTTNVNQGKMVYKAMRDLDGYNNYTVSVANNGLPTNWDISWGSNYIEVDSTEASAQLEDCQFYT